MMSVLLSALLTHLPDRSHESMCLRRWPTRLSASSASSGAVCPAPSGRRTTWGPSARRRNTPHPPTVRPFHVHLKTRMWRMGIMMPRGSYIAATC